MVHQLLRVLISGVAVSALTTILLLSGCSANSLLIIKSNSSGHVLMSDARHTESATGDTVEGTLTIVGSCFGLDTSTGDFAAVFPQGSGQVENTDQVEIPGWGTLGLGSHYQGGGQILNSTMLSYHDDIPTECQADQIIVIDPIR